ncbi:thioesterase domain-containing protein [Micromonospora sp. M12]
MAFEVTRRLEERGLAGPAALFVSGRRAPSIVVESRVHLLDDAGVLAEMRRLDGTDARLLLDEEVVRMIMPSIRGDYTAIETYHCLPPSATVSCPVEALIGDNDSRVSVDQAKAWADHTTAGFGLRVFPGGHFYLIDAAPEIAAHLADRLRVTPEA